MPEFDLHDGRSCVNPVDAGHSVYAIRGGREELLVPGTAIDAAIGRQISGAITCDTFDGEDYLNAFGSFVLKVEGHTVRLVAAGRIIADGPHHLLIESISLEAEQQHPAYYLEAVAP